MNKTSIFFKKFFWNFSSDVNADLHKFKFATVKLKIIFDWKLPIKFQNLLQTPPRFFSKLLTSFMNIPKAVFLPEKVTCPQTTTNFWHFELFIDQNKQKSFKAFQKRAREFVQFNFFKRFSEKFLSANCALPPKTSNQKYSRQFHPSCWCVWIGKKFSSSFVLIKKVKIHWKLLRKSVQHEN